MKNLYVYVSIAEISGIRPMPCGLQCLVSCVITDILLLHLTPRAIAAGAVKTCTPNPLLYLLFSWDISAAKGAIQISDMYMCHRQKFKENFCLSHIWSPIQLYKVTNPSVR